MPAAIFAVAAGMPLPQEMRQRGQAHSPGTAVILTTFISPEFMS